MAVVLGLQCSHLRQIHSVGATKKSQQCFIGSTAHLIQAVQLHTGYQNDQW